MPNRLTRYILVALVLGVIAGWAIHAYAGGAEAAKTIAGYLSIVTDVFLRPDQDDHRAPRAGDADHRHRAHGVGCRDRADVRAHHRLVHRRQSRVAEPRAADGDFAPPRQRRRPRAARRRCRIGGREDRLRSEDLRHPRRTALDLRGDERQRGAADRRLLDVRRARADRHRRARHDRSHAGSTRSST